MPLLNASQAAKLFNKSRMTIHRYLASNRLSSSIANDGTRQIDLAELIRVFGEPNRLPEEVTPVTPSKKASKEASDSPVTPTDTGIQQSLLAAIERLEATVKSQQEVIERNTAKIEELTTALLRIEYKPEAPLEQPPVPDNFLDDVEIISAIQGLHLKLEQTEIKRKKR